MNNRCTVPFFGPFQFFVDRQTVTPCCNIKSSTINYPNGILTDDIVSLRKSMIANERHEFCAKCWSITDSGGPSMRSRFSMHDKMHIDWNNMSIDHLPHKVELTFSNKCQMQCIYCGPQSSVLWENSLETTHQGSKDIAPIIDILNSLTLSEIVVTGGEPMLDENCIDFLLNLNFDPTRKIFFVTNLSYGNKTFDKLLDIIKRHPNIVVTCSIDSVGDNISRKYLNWRLWDKNFKELVNNLQLRKEKYPSAAVVAKVTLNMFNYSKIGDVIRYILEFRKQNLSGVTIALGSVGSKELSSLNSIEIDKNYKVDINQEDFNLLNNYEKSLIDLVNNMIQNSSFNSKQAEQAVIFFNKHL
jgi:MoaA/NifB/PqqE/SkfB family radical SAM enzyme